MKIQVGAAMLFLASTPGLFGCSQPGSFAENNPEFYSDAEKAEFTKRYPHQPRGWDDPMFGGGGGSGGD